MSIDLPLREIISVVECELAEARVSLKRAMPVAARQNVCHEQVALAEAAVWACRKLQRFPRWE